MGLLEKALEFKKEVNSKGRETLIDRIQGPAETGFIEEEYTSSHSPEEKRSSETSEILDDELFQLPADDASLPEYNDSDDGGVFSQNKPDETPSKQQDQAREIISPAEEGPLGSEDEPDLSTVRKRIKSMQEDEVVDAELDITIFEDDDTVQDGSDTAETGNADIRNGITFDSGAVDAQQEESETREEPDKEEKAAADEKWIDRERKKEATPPAEDFHKQKEPPIGKTLSHKIKFHDFMVLYEIGKEIYRAENLQTLYDIVIFSIMGQIGVSSTTILVPSEGDENSWVIAESRGIQLRDNTIIFSTEAGILGSLAQKRAIVDLDDYKEKQGFQEEYFKLISIDARLLCPLSYNGTIFGAIVLGEKISIGEYTEAEKDFILSISEISAMAIGKMKTIDSLGQSLAASEREVLLTNAMDEVIEKTGGSIDTDTLNDMISGFCEKAGLLSYGLFLFDAQMNEYIPEVVDPKDSLRFKEDDFRIQKTSPLIDLINNSLDGMIIEDFKHHETVKKLFHENTIMRMSMFRIYPVRSGGELIGFLGLFGLGEDSSGPDADSIIHRSAATIIRALYIRKNIIRTGRYYLDIVDSAMGRIEDSFQRARELNIPLSFVLFSIKNLKRYYSLYGRDEASLLLRNMRNVILSRLSDTDYAIRLDRNKVLLTLPGKNKKFAIPMANAIRNELVQSFKKKEMQLMLVYITATYPEDGDDIYTLLENLE